MKNKLKKIITTTLVSAVSLTAIGCASNNNKLAKNIDKSMENFVSSINSLDYVETSKSNTASAKSPSMKNIGKIVETSTIGEPGFKIKTSGNHIQFLNNNISEAEIENTIKIPSERTDNFNLFILSSTPFVTLSSDDNNSLNLNVKFSTNQITETSDEIESKINSLILKRSILMIYVNEIYNGNVNLTSENKLAINAYVNVIKENTSFLNGNRGMVKNQLKLASDLATSEQNENLINYYIIKSGEALENRASKLDSTISAIDSIISIIEANLTNSSNYYQTNLSGTYNNLVNQTNNITPIEEISESSTNQEIAGKIACTLDFCNLNKNSTELDTAKHSPANISHQQKNEINHTPQITRNIQPQRNNSHTSQSENENTNLNKNSTENNQPNTFNNPRNTENTTNQNNINNENQNNQSNENNSNISKIRRIPNSVRQRRRYYHNNNTHQENSNNEPKDNLTSNTATIKHLDSRNNIMNNNTKTLRTDRTNENLNNEEYTTTSSSLNEPRATRVPYKSTYNTFEN